MINDGWGNMVTTFEKGQSLRYELSLAFYMLMAILQQNSFMNFLNFWLWCRLQKNPGIIVVEYAPYRVVKSFDHKYGHSHSKSASSIISFVCQGRFGTANSLHQIKTGPPWLRHSYFVHDTLPILWNNFIVNLCWGDAFNIQKSDHTLHLWLWPLFKGANHLSYLTIYQYVQQHCCSLANGKCIGESNVPHLQNENW